MIASSQPLLKDLYVVWDIASDQAWWLMNVLSLSKGWPHMKKIAHYSESVSHDNITCSKLIHSQNSNNYEGPGKWKGMFCLFLPSVFHSSAVHFLKWRISLLTSRTQIWTYCLMILQDWLGIDGVSSFCLSLDISRFKNNLHFVLPLHPVQCLQKFYVKHMLKTSTMKEIESVTM